MECREMAGAEEGKEVYVQVQDENYPYGYIYGDEILNTANQCVLFKSTTMAEVTALSVKPPNLKLGRNTQSIPWRLWDRLQHTTEADNE